MKTIFNLLSNLSGFIINDSFYAYIKLIGANLNTPRQQGKTQVHHIIPEAYYGKRNTKENNTDDRVVNLLFKDHVLAHYYLAKCTSGELNNKMLIAFAMMTNFDTEKILVNLPDYQLLYEQANKAKLGIEPPNKGKPMSAIQKEKISQALMGHQVSAETRKRQSDAQKNMLPEKRANITAASKNRNFHFTEEQKKKKSEVAMGHEVTEETRKKISESRKNKKMTWKWINNGIINKQVFDGAPIPDGWFLGRVLFNKYWITNGIENRFILKTEAIPEGWYQGRTCKGRQKA